MTNSKQHRVWMTTSIVRFVEQPHIAQQLALKPHKKQISCLSICPYLCHPLTLNLFRAKLWSKASKQCQNTELLRGIKHVLMGKQQLIKSRRSYNYYKWWVQSEEGDLLPPNHSCGIHRLIAFPKILRSSNDTCSQPLK